MNLTKQATPDLMAQCLRRVDKQVQAYCADIYKSAVVCGKWKFSVDHPSFKGIETLVEGLANDADAIRDVCSDTHSYLCSVSKVYSYSEDAHINLVGDRIDDVFDVVNELVVDYLDEKLEYKKDVAISPPCTNNEYYVVDIQ